jgi:hypothetical protein
VLFGRPAALDNASERAVRAALATQRALTELNRINADANRPPLSARITIDSGPPIIDAAGEVFGQLPNLVAQAQALAAPGAILITARVQQQVDALFVVKECGCHEFKGVLEPVTLYRIIRPSGGGDPRPNYHRLIARAVKGSDGTTAEARQVVYERARKALVAQLRFSQPGLSKAEMAKESFALEEAIRKVEIGAARTFPTDAPTELRAGDTPTAALDPAAQAGFDLPQRKRANSPPAQLRSAASPADEIARPLLKRQLMNRPQDHQALGPVSAIPAKSARRTREGYKEAAEDLQVEGPAAYSHQLDQLDVEPQGSTWTDFDARKERDDDPPYIPEQARALAVRPLLQIPPSMMAADEYERTRRPLSYGALARLLAVLIILAGMVAAISWQWSVIIEFYRLLSPTGSKPQSSPSHRTSLPRSSLSGPVPKEQDIWQTPATAMPAERTDPIVAQRVVLREEHPAQQDRGHVVPPISPTETLSQGPD